MTNHSISKYLYLSYNSKSLMQGKIHDVDAVGKHFGDVITLQITINPIILYVWNLFFVVKSHQSC